MDSTSIDTLRIYPPLGIARVGNAEEEADFVVGPEVIGGTAMLPDGRAARFVSDFRAADGRIKRHAARFRIYAHMKDGTVEEVTAASANIKWHVTVANLKAGWYEFNQAMDLPDGLSQDANQRNLGIQIPGGRPTLDIVPTPLTIEGSDAPAVAFNDGTFWRQPVYLGELRTDTEGRLLFLGGRGDSRAFRKGINPLTFANNVGWHDDVADGPVRATVTFPGEKPIEAEPGYVVVTPPNFAPGLIGVVTMDDVVRETFYDQSWIAPPVSTSFTRDIWPIFDRLTGLQWVNHGLFVLNGNGSPLDARDPQVIVRLQDRTAKNAPWRDAVLALFRTAGAVGNLDAPKLPQVFGDGVDTLFSQQPPDALALLAVTRTQYAHLRRWAAGDFSDDWPGAVPTPPDFARLTPAEQVAQLERAGLHDCLGGPFHPGIEITWIMRLPRLWKQAYRLNVLPENQPAKQDYGLKLTPDVCTGAGGPCDGVAAGSLTRFLGVPWQTDGTSCNSSSDYFPSTFLSMPTFWGARVPDQVLAVENYNRAAALDPSTSMVQIQKHFMLRVDWLRDVRDVDYYGRLHNMVESWWQLGMVVPMEDAPAHLPADTRVEQGRHSDAAGDDVKPDLVKAVEALAASEPTTARSRALSALATVTPHPRKPPKRRFRRDQV